VYPHRIINKAMQITINSMPHGRKSTRNTPRKFNHRRKKPDRRMVAGCLSFAKEIRVACINISCSEKGANL